MKIKRILYFVVNFILLSTLFYKVSLASEPVKKTNYDSLPSLESVLGTLVQQTFDDLKVPGAIIGVTAAGYQPWTTALGVSDLKTGTPMKSEDKVRIGSITKTFTGTVLLQLIEEGKLTLNDKLSLYFPGYPDGDNITIQELGDMRSGLYNYSEDSTFGAALMANMEKPYTPDELISISMKHAPYFPPDSNFHYSNTNTILLGLIIEKLTGNPLQTEIQNRILNPLGMKNTTFELDSNFPDPHAHGYMYIDSASTVPTDVSNLNPSWGWSAGSMISNLADIQLYAKPLATGKLLSSKLQQDRLNWKTQMDIHGGSWKGEELKYGFAIASFNGAIGHNGGIPGFNSFMGYLPEKDATIIVFVNMQDNQAGLGPADYLAKKIIEKLKGM